MALFNIYTYQFKPIFRDRLLFDDPDINAEKAMNKKNEVFADALKNITFIKYRNKIHNLQFIINTETFFVFRIDNARKIKIEKKFKVREDIDEPSSMVIIYNDKNVQRIAIEDNINTFADTDTIARIIREGVEDILNENFLEITIRKEYSRNEFWDLVNLYRDSITKVTFFFDYPNLPRVRSLVPDVLKNISKKTHSTRTKLTLETNEQLILDESDGNIKDLVNGASDCGSKISIGIKGLRKVITTGHSSKTINLNELNIQGNIDEIKNILQEINE